MKMRYTSIKTNYSQGGACYLCDVSLLCWDKQDPLLSKYDIMGVCVRFYKSKAIFIIEGEKQVI